MRSLGLEPQSLGLETQLGLEPSLGKKANLDIETSLGLDIPLHLFEPRSACLFLPVERSTYILSLKNSLGLEIGPGQASAKVETKMFVFAFSRKFIFAFRQNLVLLFAKIYFRFS